MEDLETMFSNAVVKRAAPGPAAAPKSGGKVQLVELRRANNCEIMLSQFRLPLLGIIDAVLSLDTEAIAAEQVEGLLKLGLPTREEAGQLRGYKGPREKLGKCEQWFFEILAVPYAPARTRVHVNPKP